MRTWPLIATLVAVAVPGVPLGADTVYLTNGGTFEGVMAEVTGSKVTIRMQSGTISLPLTQVARIDNRDSSLSQFLSRKEALQRNGGGATAWIELAQWARGRGLNQVSRETALVAAQIDPKAAGLADLMRGFGFVFDDEVGRWISYDDSMRRKGLVRSNGQWVARAEYEAAERSRQAAADERRQRFAEAARAAREERLAHLTELAIAREIQQQAPAAPQVGYPQTLLVLPGYFFPPVVPVPTPPQTGNGAPQPAPTPDPRPREEQRSRGTFARVPGSLIPGQYPSTNPYPRN